MAGQPLSGHALRAARTYGAAADHYGLPSLGFWDRFGAGDHHAGGGDTGQACQSQHFPPAHLLRLDHARREH